MNTYVTGTTIKQLREGRNPIAAERVTISATTMLVPKEALAHCHNVPAFRILQRISFCGIVHAAVSSLDSAIT